MLRGHRDLKIYQVAYKLAMEIFEETKTFPNEECYSLTDQIRRSSRSVAANIAEGFRKRRYPNMFISKMADSDAEATETQVWLDFSHDCGHLSGQRHEQLVAEYEELGRMIGSIINDPSKFTP
jgi:four helix bundle protein